MKIKLWINGKVSIICFEHASDEAIKLLISIAHIGIVDRFEISFEDD